MMKDGFQYLKIALLLLATLGELSVRLTMLIQQNSHLKGQPRLEYSETNGVFVVLFDHECHPEVLYLEGGGRRSHAMPGISLSKNSCATMELILFKTGIPSLFHPNPSTFSKVESSNF